MVSRSIRQSGELFRKFESFYSMLDSPPPTIKSTELSCELANKSRVVSLPDSEDTIRGFSSVDLLIEDESSRVNDELYYAIRPMLAVSEGQLLLLGTPHGKLGHFYEVWESENDLWEKVLITVDDCPRISKQFLESERRSMPESWFLQEYYCKFQDTIDQVFDSNLVDSLFSDEIVPLFPTNKNCPFGEVTNQTTENDSLISDKIKTLEEESHEVTGEVSVDRAQL
jgi:hypothetical protein